MKNLSFFALFMLLSTGLFAQSPGGGNSGYIIVEDVIMLNGNSPREASTNILATFEKQQVMLEKEEQKRKEQALAEADCLRLIAIEPKP